VNVFHSNTTGATSRAGTAKSSVVPGFTPGYFVVLMLLNLYFSVWGFAVHCLINEKGCGYK
jgi:hypothetical protein